MAEEHRLQDGHDHALVLCTRGVLMRRMSVALDVEHLVDERGMSDKPSPRRVSRSDLRAVPLLGVDAQSARGAAKNAQGDTNAAQ